jgi:hypothetical protein
MFRIFGILLSTAILFSSSQARAQEELNISVDGALDAYSQYIWRGYNLGDKVAMQPSLTLGFGESGLSLNIWGSASLQNRDSLKGADELDFTLSYDRTISEESGVGLSVGYIQYTFPSADSGTHTEEFYAGISLDNAAAPSLTAYYDFGLVDAWYLTLGIGPEFPLDTEGKVSLGLGASIGISDGTGSMGFNDVTISASLGIVAGTFTISPVLGYCFADKDVNENESEFWGGLSISFSK